MQQYRLNFPLLIGLIVGTFISSGAVYGLWRIQMERKSGWLISEAKKSREAKDYREAAHFYDNYLSIHPENTEARFELANTLIDLTDSEDATNVDLIETIKKLENLLRTPKIAELPESKNVRRRLITLYGRDSVRNYSSALDHLAMLLEADPANVELQVLRASYLAKSQDFDKAIEYSYQLIGYDPKASKFDVKNAKAPHEPQVYSTLAGILRGKQNKSELAERVLDQMVEANPKNAQAYIERGRLRASPAWGKNLDGARADAEQAYKLKPDDLDALLLMAEIASRDEKFDKAGEYIEKAKKLHPSDTRVYQAAAIFEIGKQASAKPDAKQALYDKAVAQIDEGRKNVAGPKALDLLIFKIELQIQAQDVKGARETIAELQKLHSLNPDVINYFNARLEVVEEKWFQASEDLSKIRSQMGIFGRDRAIDVDYSLGLCYERLGRLDLAKKQYDLVLQQNPQNEPARAGAMRVDAMRGIESTQSGGADQLQELIAKQMKMPKSERDWTQVDKMVVELAEKRQLDETSVKLMQAQLMMMREDYDGAKKLLVEAKALSPKNLNVQRLIIQLARIDSKIGPAKAMELMDKAFADFGDIPALRVDKAELLIQLNKDQQDKEPLKHELAKLLDGIESWTVPQKIELWRGLARDYLSLNMFDEAQLCLSLAAEKQPNELPLRLALFSLALDLGDDDGMKEAQEKILQIVGDKNDSNWLYADARRRLVLLRRGLLPPEALKEIRRQANQALQQRNEWFELHVLLAEIELMANNPALALEHYDRAEELGRPNAAAVAQHIKLLAAYGRFPDAGKLIDRIPEAGRQNLLGPLYAEILFRINQTDEAVKQAKAATENDPNNGQNFYWYGQLLARSAQSAKVSPEQRTAIMADAVKATQRASELQPQSPDVWFALINYHVMQKDEAQAQKALRDAQLALSGDTLTIFLARSYELLHRWFDAETMYREIYETAPDDIGRAQQLAAFYLGPIYQRPDQQQKATPLLNQILKAGADKKIPANDGNLLWARRMAARIYSSTNEYPNLLKAEKLLASNSQDGSLLIEDKLAMAEILTARPEPVSRLKAIGLLEAVSKIQPLSERNEIQLAELYYLTSGFSGKYKRQIEKAMALFPNSALARQSYANKLLINGDPRYFAEAAKQVTKLRELNPNNPTTFQLTVRLAGKLGKQQQVLADLKNRIPNIQDMKEIDPTTAQSITMIADLLVELGDLDSAEKIYTDLAARIPAMRLDLARFLGLHRDPEKAFAKLNEIYTRDNVNDVLSVALDVSRARRDKVGDKYDADIQRWLDAGLRENPDSIPLLMTQGAFYDLLKKYEDTANVYRKLLARNDLRDFRRAVVLNNLAFLLAIDPTANGGADNPLKFVQEAADILGPNSDILDTRAVVFIAQKDYAAAIRDLELCVTDNPTASKYYHKARAHLLNKEIKAATEAWAKAEALGLNHDALNRMEFQQYDEMKKQMEQLGKKPVTRAEPPRNSEPPVLTTAP